jgi:fatty acid amide hydrolase
MGELNIRATIGPLARCTDDLVLVMRSLLQENMWYNDPELARQPWRDELFKNKKRLTIGFYTNDNWFPPAPACIRAVNEAAEVLRKLGHTVIPYTPIDVAEAVRIFVAIIGADGSRHFIESLENEPINPLYTPLLQVAKLPNFLRPLIARLMRIMGERRNAHIVQAVGSKTAYEYFDLVIDLKKYIKKWLDDLRKNNIDLLLVCKDKNRFYLTKNIFFNRHQLMVYQHIVMVNLLICFFHVVIHFFLIFCIYLPVLYR